MPTYKYIVRDKKGKPREGFLEVHNEDELIGILQSRDFTVVSFTKIKTGDDSELIKKNKRMHYGAGLEDLIVLSRQLATLLNSGVTLLRSLEIIIIQVESVRLQIAIEAIKRDVSTGSSLKSALSRHPKIFSKLWISIVETGETTGQLSFALQQLTTYLEEVAELKRRILNAVIYPAMVLVVTAVAVNVFIFFIIPTFEKIYTEFGSELPAFTKFVFFICRNLKRYILVFAGLIVAIFFSIRYYGKIYEGRKQIDGIKLRIYLLGMLIKEISAARFASAMSMLLNSGTPILQALDIAIETSNNTVIMEMLQKVKQNVREGKSMAEPLIKEGIFPDMLGHMVAVGEESGELSKMLENAAIFYNKRVETLVGRLTAIFEPLLIIFIGLIVGTFVIAMFLPIFGLASAVK